jgi:hypothetical protein
MTQRERTMLTLVCGVLGAVAVIGGLFYFIRAFTNVKRDLDAEQTQVAELENKLIKVKADQRVLEHWRQLSLPGDLNVARGDYKQYLIDLMRKTNVQLETFPQAPQDSKSTAAFPNKNKSPVWTGINFNVRAKTDMAGLVAFLEEFQKTPKMHRIKALTVERSETTAKKGSQELTVQFTVEALSILDADKDLKKGLDPEKARIRSAELEVLMGLRRAPLGLFAAGWALSPTGSAAKGQILMPLNPPLALRNYKDIVKRNIFITAEPARQYTEPQPLPDDTINRMRFNRLVAMLTDPKDNKVQIKLYDLWTGDMKRYKPSGGFDRIPLLQTAPINYGQSLTEDTGIPGQQNAVPAVLVYGVVKAIEDRDVVLQIMLNTSEANNSSWWRYPDQYKYYKLQKEDLTRMRLRPEDEGHLYVCSRKFWDQQVQEKRLDIRSGGKFYVCNTDSSHGAIVHEDNSAVIIRPASWPPQAAVEDPKGVAVYRLYPQWDTIYEIQKDHFNQLMAQNNKLKKEDIVDLCVMHKDFWEFLEQDGLIKPEGGGGTWVLYPAKKLMKFEKIEQDANKDIVVFRLPPKNCYYPGMSIFKDSKEDPKAIQNNRIKSISANKREIVVGDNDGKDRTISLAKDAQIMIGRVECALSDLQAGDLLVIMQETQGKKEVATQVRVVDRPPQRIKSINLEKGEVVVAEGGGGGFGGGGKGGGGKGGGKEKTYVLAKDGTVVFNSEECKLADLMPGDSIVVTVEAAGEKLVVSHIRCVERPARWHEGYIVLKLGRFIQDALGEPVPQSELGKYIPGYVPAGAGQGD